MKWILVYCLWSFPVFSQNDAAYRSNFYIEPAVAFNNVHYQDYDLDVNNKTILRGRDQNRFTFSTDIMYRNKHLNTGIGNTWFLMGNDDSFLTGLPSQKRFLFLRDVYAKIGLNFSKNPNYSKNFHGLYVHLGYLTNDLVDAHWNGNLGYEIYLDGLRLSVHYGMFYFTKFIREKYKSANESMSFNRSFQLSLAYSFRVQDPWRPK